MLLAPTSNLSGRTNAEVKYWLLAPEADSQRTTRQIELASATRSWLAGSSNLGVQDE